MLDQRCWRVVSGYEPQFVSVTQDERPIRPCLAEARCVLQHGLEHRLKLAGRARDDAQDLRRRRLLLQRLGELAGAQLDLFFQARIGLLQPAGHVVELVSESLQLVAGLDLDALGEVAAADALGARAQRLDRADHAPRHIQPHDERRAYDAQRHGSDDRERAEFHHPQRLSVCVVDLCPCACDQVVDGRGQPF